MRKAIRFENTLEYWDRRWSVALSDADSFDNLSIYPIKYAEMVMQDSQGIVAELGCGLGRIMKHYHKQSGDIIGIERSKIAVKRIKKDCCKLKVCVADVKNLPFKYEIFDTILAFGLYHNIEQGMLDALKESLRCLKLGGQFCISMRPDNIEMRLNEYYWYIKNKRLFKRQKKHFHKWLVTEKEFLSLLNDNHCKVESVERARNVSILWRIPYLRRNQHLPYAGEQKLRSTGYTLNFFGKLIDDFLTKNFPAHFCNVLVFIGRKVD